MESNVVLGSSPSVGALFCIAQLPSAAFRCDGRRPVLPLNGLDYSDAGASVRIAWRASAVEGELVDAPFDAGYTAAVPHLRVRACGGQQSFLA